jgi:hypothetical protein
MRWQKRAVLYGWPQERGAGFISRHPELRASKGTIQLRPQDAAGLGDDELPDLVRVSLEP